MIVLLYVPILLLIVWGATMLICRTRGRFRFYLTGIAILAALIGYAGSLLAEIHFPAIYANVAAPLLAALPMALFFSIILSFLSFPTLRLTNPLGTIDPFLPAAVLALSLGSATCACLGWQEWSNGHDDAQPAVAEQGLVTDTQEEVGRSGKICRVSLTVEEKSGTIRLAPDFCANLHAGDHVQLQIKPGNQNISWVAAITKAP